MLGIFRCRTIGSIRATTRYCLESSITTPVRFLSSSRRKVNCGSATRMACPSFRR